ncbi:hypothetical protein [Endozoicomonas sp. 8E]|uniref:hypothetical protein n=1 Tax=Endozoicomonas sp. 8E TaxID=3035692 RepID=UPI0029394825|nr:hypothetical protein [Endozoicomonas sp. 8E]WOG25955.1 hypothetical protein P6910_15395 [Endozoicomonas sp. 8E]
MVDDSDQAREPTSGRDNPEKAEFLFFWQNLFARIKRLVSDREDVIRMDSDSRIVRANLLNLQIEGGFEHFWIAEHPGGVVEDNHCESVVDDELFSELLAAEEEWIRLQQIRDQFRKNTD